MSDEAVRAKNQNMSVLGAMLNIIGTHSGDDFLSEVVRLAKFLDDERAYYPEALPTYVELFEVCLEP